MDINSEFPCSGGGVHQQFLGRSVAHLLCRSQSGDAECHSGHELKGVDSHPPAEERR